MSKSSSYGLCRAGCQMRLRQWPWLLRWREPRQRTRKPDVRTQRARRRTLNLTHSHVRCSQSLRSRSVRAGDAGEGHVGGAGAGNEQSRPAMRRMPTPRPRPPAPSAQQFGQQARRGRLWMPSICRLSSGRGAQPSAMSPASAEDASARLSPRRWQSSTVLTRSQPTQWDNSALGPYSCFARVCSFTGRGGRARPASESSLKGSTALSRASGPSS